MARAKRHYLWEDRYHATAVESSDHLARCLAYIDTNRVRAGVVSHPPDWPFSGPDEIQNFRRKNVLIDYQRLQGLFGAGSYEQFSDLRIKFCAKWIEFIKEYVLDPDQLRYFQLGLYLHHLVPAGPGWDESQRMD